MTKSSLNSEDTGPSASNGLEGRGCVPFFDSDKAQIRFEFWYLVVLFLAASSLMITLQLFGQFAGLKHCDKLAFFALIGGFFGGWVYDTKWFYRVTARGKNDQYAFPWQPHKFYWRVLTPFLAGIVAFAVFLLASADFLPIAIKNKESARSAFAICFVLGYFSDLVLSRLATWAEKIIPKASSDKRD